LIAGLFIFSNFIGFNIYKKCKTNIEITPESFIVSNYELFRGEYRFVYTTKPSGREHLIYSKKNCVVFVDTIDNDPNKTRVQIRLENFGEFNPLSDKLITPKYFFELGDDTKTNSELGEEILNEVRREYKDKIPFPNVNYKIEKDI